MMIAVENVPPSASLLAQASRVAGQEPLTSETTSQTLEDVSIGPGRDGVYSGATGFLSPFGLAESLPNEFAPWEVAIRRLPHLLRKGTTREAVSALPSLKKELLALPDRFLSRAAIIISSLLQAFAFETRNLEIMEEKEASLPQGLVNSWDVIAARLGRPLGIRTIADDLLNNVRMSGTSAGIAIEYFDLPEERMSAGLQVAMEHAFAPALEAVTKVQKYIRMEDDAGVIRELYTITDCVIACAKTFLSVTCHNRKHGFDPMIWGKSYPEIGRSIRPGGMTNSGVNAPLFHCLDAFIGIMDPENEMYKQQITRRSLLPPSIRRFIESVGDAGYSIRSYIEKREGSPVAASFDSLLQIYAWLLERHRMRAVGSITIALASGRQQTAGGARQEHAIRFDELLDKQMKRAIDGRFGTRPRYLTATLESISLAGRKTTVLTVCLPCPIPVRAGDRIEIWAQEHNSDTQLQQSTWMEESGPISEQTEPRAHLYDPYSPRHYSVADVESTEHNGLSQRVVLTVAHSGGLCSEFLRSSVTLRQVKIKVIPAPDSWSPEDDSVPLLLIAQGAGVGPYLGFLNQRRRLKQREDRQIGDITLVVCAKELDDVPHLPELTRLTRLLPQLTVHLALSRGIGSVIRCGDQNLYHETMKVQDVLLGLDRAMKTQLSAQNGHIYVCGSVGFGSSVRTALQKLNIFDPLRYHEDCFGGRTNTAKSAPETIVTPRELARHNKPDDLWMAISDTVYDLSSFANTHPGGIKTLIESAGTVADRRFYQIHSGDLSQGVMAQIGQYAVGSLEGKDHLSESRKQLLSETVTCQNVLTNNTYCAPGRTMPFYIIADSLLVTIRGLENLSSAIHKEEATLALLRGLEKRLKQLKSTSWSFIGNASSLLLEPAEAAVRSIYSAHWEELHLLFDDMKSFCCDNDIDDVTFLPNFQALLRSHISKIQASVEHAITTLKT